MKGLYSISGYFADDKTEFENYLVYEYDNQPEELKDEDIFFYGISENEIKLAIKTKEPTQGEFVITSYQRQWEEEPIKTIQIAFNSQEWSEAPEKLECVATLEQIQEIREVYKYLSKIKDKLSTISLKGELYTVSDDDYENWRYDVSHINMHIHEDNPEDITVYQYIQNKYDSGDQIETGAISLNELEEYLKKQS